MEEIKDKIRKLIEESTFMVFDNTWWGNNGEYTNVISVDDVMGILKMNNKLIFEEIQKKMKENGIEENIINKILEYYEK